MHKNKEIERTSIRVANFTSSMNDRLVFKFLSVNFLNDESQEKTTLFKRLADAIIT